MLEYHQLLKFISENWKPNKNNYVLIDEVQMCKNFEIAVNDLFSSNKYDIYLTGSNAFLLSSDLATLFTGRYMSINIFPFSFQEYLDIFEIKENYQQAFDEYARIGSLPGVYQFENDREKSDYIENVFQVAILKDIIQKYKIRNISVLEKVSDFLINNISNITSIHNIAQTLAQEKTPINYKTLSSYVNYLCQAFVFYSCKRYDLVGKEYLKSGEKFYLSDHGVRYAKHGFKNLNFDRMYENIVAIELMRLGYKVYVGKLYKKEIDFVAESRNEKFYIQVADNISNEEVFNREVNSLLQIKDGFPKILIARTFHETATYEGIKIIDLVDWLRKTNNWTN